MLAGSRSVPQNNKSIIAALCVAAFIILGSLLAVYSASHIPASHEPHIGASSMTPESLLHDGVAKPATALVEASLNDAGSAACRTTTMLEGDFRPTLLIFMEGLSRVAEIAAPGFDWNSMGHIGQIPQQIMYFYKEAKNPAVKTICEIGFNAGHSSAVFLIANPNATLYTFDLGIMPYSNIMKSYFERLFPGRFKYYKGSSQTTVPAFNKANPNFPGCDLVSIDGAHKGRGPAWDVLNMCAIARPGATIILDDERWSGCRRAWEKGVATGYMTERECVDSGFRINGIPKSWCVGTILKAGRK
jgi:hypothetical protein